MAQTKCGFNDGKEISGSQLLVSFGPTLVVDIGFDPNHDMSKRGVPTPGIKGIQALVDTGATESYIDTLLAAQLNLPVVDKRTTAGAHGKKEMNVYLAQVTVPALKVVINGLFTGVDLAAGGQVHKALIGRTFLKNFTMTYEGKTGTVTISS